MMPGDQSELLYGGPRQRQRDRTGEIVEADDVPALHDDYAPAVTPVMRAERYYRARRRADQIIPRLTAAELEAVADAIRTERERRTWR